MLEREVKCFNENLPVLLGKHKGKFVLIHDDRVISVFHSKEDAVSRGYEECGINPFLVKRIQEFEPAIYFTSNLICPKGEPRSGVVHG